MLPSFQDVTDKTVFWIFHSINLFLIICMGLTAILLSKENVFELVLAELFILGALFTFWGSFAGGLLGAVMEEDPCGRMDMGVLSTMGAFMGATVFSLGGCALVGLYLFVDPIWIHSAVIFTSVCLFIFSSPSAFHAVRTVPIDTCGNRLDSQGNPLKKQPLKMKNKMAVMLALTVVAQVSLTLLMVFIMKRDLSNQWMIGGMMYGMGGAMVGGMLGGWLAGLKDKHVGEANCDNPVMVSAMSLMGGMMAGMLSGMIGGMNALMGMGTIVPTVLLPLVLCCVFYFWMFRNEFKWSKSSSRAKSNRIGGYQWANE